MKTPKFYMSLYYTNLKNYKNIFLNKFSLKDYILVYFVLWLDYETSFIKSCYFNSQL